MGKFNKRRTLAGGGRVALSSLLERPEADETTELPDDGEPLVRWFIGVPSAGVAVELCGDTVTWSSSQDLARITTPALGDYPSRVLNLALQRKLEYPCDLVITLRSHSLIVEAMDADDVVASVGITEALTRWICRWWRDRLAEDDV